MPATASPPTRRRPAPVRYQAVADDLRRRIECGELKIGEKLPSYLELQNTDGVATYTADRAYSILEREGLIERRARSGVYVAQPRARTTQNVVGLACSVLSEYRHHPYFMELLSGVQQALAAEGVQVLLIGGNSANVRWETIGGVLFYESQTWLSSPAAQLPPGMPAVSLMERSDRGNLSSVTVDDYGGMRQAAEHLLTQNHCRIAYLAGDSLPLLEQRHAGYADALRAAGIEPDPQWRRIPTFYEPGHDYFEAGSNTMRRWLQEGWSSLDCTALLCQNDDVAAGAMQALREAGVLVPQDVSIVGFDDQRICNLVSPALTTVRVPLRKIGARAAQLLLAQMRANDQDGQREIQSVTLPIELQIRNSTGPAQKLSGISSLVS